MAKFSRVSEISEIMQKSTTHTALTNITAQHDIQALDDETRCIALVTDIIIILYYIHLIIIKKYDMTRPSPRQFEDRLISHTLANYWA